jgi:PIN domain nuclease of toxin-antitoxin system
MSGRGILCQVRVSIKIGLGKLAIDQGRFFEQLNAAGFEPLDISWEHATTVRFLPDIHRDPFDHMLIAQAISEPLKLMTADTLLSGYSELIITV